MSRIVPSVIKNYAVKASGIISGSYPASRAFDGNVSSYTNRWVSPNGSFTANAPNYPTWWQIKLDRPMTVTKIQFYISTTHIKRFQFMVSDTGAFTGEETICGDITITEVNNTTSISPTAVYEIPLPTEGRYIRLNVLESHGSDPWVSINEILMFDDEISIVRMHITADNGGNSYVTVVELEMFDHPDGGFDLCQNGLADASSEANIENIAKYAFDDNPNVKWSHNGSSVSIGNPAWVQYEFRTPLQVSIKAYNLIACIAGQTTFAPTDWTIQVSSDGTNFTTVQSISRELGWTGGEERSFAIGAGSISGVTKINGLETQCTVRLYDHTTGELLNTTLSDDITGEYVFEDLIAGEYEVVCIGDETVCPHIAGPLEPVGDTFTREYTGVTSLRMDFNEVDGFNTYFADTGRYNTTVAGFGGIAHSDEQAHRGKTSLKLDGTDDYLSVANVLELFSVIGDFTCEAWVYRAVSGARHVIFSKYVNVNTDGFVLEILTDDTLSFSVGSGVYQNVVSVATVPAGQWVHVAGVKSGQDIMVFINGNLEATTTTTGTPNNNTTPLFIGRDSIATDRHFNGFLDEIEITQDYAKYTENFTPETPTLSTAYYSAVLASAPTAYWRLDDDTATMVDDLGTYDGTHTGSPTQNKAPLINAGSGRSMKYNGSSQYSTVPDNVALRPGTGEYAIELWGSFTSTGLGMIFGKFSLVLPYPGPTIFANYKNDATSVGTIEFRDTRTSGYWVDTTANWLNDGIPRHYVFQRRLVSTGPDVYELQIYINGALDNSVVLPTVIDHNNTEQLYICSRPTQYVAGNFDEVAYYVGKSLTPSEILAHYQAALF